MEPRQFGITRSREALLCRWARSQGKLRRRRLRQRRQEQQEQEQEQGQEQDQEMHGRKRTNGTIVVRHAQGKEGRIGMRESWMQSEKGARARGRIERWFVTIVMVRTTLLADLVNMYALAH